MKRKYTKDLLVAFKELCDRLPWQGPKQRCALGVAVVAEAGIEIKDFEHTARSPLFGEIASAFYEMLENNWIEEVNVNESTRGDLYLEFEDQIVKIYGKFSSDSEQMRKILSKGWPLGDHCFRLTIKGEETAEKARSPVWKKGWYILKDNAKPIIITVVGVIIARFLLFLITELFGL